SISTTVCARGSSDGDAADKARGRPSGPPAFGPQRIQPLRQLHEAAAALPGGGPGDPGGRLAADPPARKPRRATADRGRAARGPEPADGERPLYGRGREEPAL